MSNEKFRRFLKEDLPAMLFLFLYALGICAFWFSVYKANFDYGNDFESIVNNAGSPVSLSLFPVICAFLFSLMLIVYGIYGFFFRNKTMLLLSAAYSFFLVAGLILLAVFNTGAITDDGLYKAVQWALVLDFGPVFGFVWVLGKAAVRIFTALFFADLIFCIIKLVKFIKRKINIK